MYLFIFHKMMYMKCLMFYKHLITASLVLLPPSIINTIKNNYLYYLIVFIPGYYIIVCMLNINKFHNIYFLHVFFTYLN